MTAGQGELTWLTIAFPLGEGTWLECYLLKEGAFSLCLANNQVFAGGIHFEAVMGNRLHGRDSPAIMVGIAEETHPADYFWTFIRYYPFIYDLENWESLTNDTWSVGNPDGTSGSVWCLAGATGLAAANGSSGWRPASSGEVC